MQTRRLARHAFFIVVALCVVLVSGAFKPITPPASGAAATCVPDQPATIGTTTIHIDNCSGLSPNTLFSLLNQTDAAAAGNIINPNDLFMANSQWLAWIDTNNSPGILRGLWKLNATTGQFVGQRDVSRNWQRSVVHPYSGFWNPYDPYGLRGLEVEIWQTTEAQYADPSVPKPGCPVAPNLKACYWTYKNGQRPTIGAPDFHDGNLLTRNYSTRLVNAANGSDIFTGLNLAQSHLTWALQYNITRAAFAITATLSADNDVNFSGDAGGLALLTNPVCQRGLDQQGNYAGCDGRQVGTTALHYVQVANTQPAVQPGDLYPKYNPLSPCQPFQRGCPICIDQPTAQDCSATVRSTAAQPNGVQSNLTTVTLRPSSTSDLGFNTFTASPGWNNLDPYSGNHTGANPHVPMTAFHFNAMPDFDDYLSGWGSLDVVYEPARGAVNGTTCTVTPTCSLVLGPNRGVMQFGLTLSHT